MAFKFSKRHIILLLALILVIPAVLGFRSFFPLKANLEPVPNPIEDHSTNNWAVIEDTLLEDPQKNVYWGDLHIHTSQSFDAYLSGTQLDPADAYHYATGQSVTIFGKQIAMSRPLDFAAVTDHSETLGEMYTVQTPGTPGYKAFVPRYFRMAYNDKKEYGVNEWVTRDIFRRALKRAGRGGLKHPGFFQGYGTTIHAWDVNLQAAENYYQPGKFTTFAAFEWSAMDGNAHLHRNVIFRDMTVPAYPLSSMEIVNEKDLWTWMDGLTGNGSTVLAIPHNTNLGEGGVFKDKDPDGQDMDRAYAQLRQDYEPLIEVHQAKGNSEVHPAVWKNDEFADFETYTFGPPREDNYVRWALKKGLEHENNLGVNPFKFGLIGSTDTHSGTPGNTEENDEFISNHGIVDATPENRSTQSWGLGGSKKSSQVVQLYEILNPGGLVAVWAEANSRGHIYDALKAKEVYATSGTRIELRFFGGWDFPREFESAQDLVAEGYRSGIPMGSDLEPKEEASPQFLIHAKKDVEGANLDRLQIIKGWYTDQEGLQERIYNVALSDGRSLDENGDAEPLSAAVNLETGESANDKGDTEFIIHWTDPDFDPGANAFYYVRVIEIPTASWRLWDMIRYGSEFPENAALTVQERAWSSPIWVNATAK